MQKISDLRQQLRGLVQAAAYSDLDRVYIDLHAQWLAAESGTHPYLDATRPDNLFDFAVLPPADAARFLQAWIAACPGAYHPRLLWGQFCFGRAAAIRGYDWASSVTQDRWLGAAMACELAAAAWIEAMALAPQPVAAGVAMMEMVAHFDEPAWLLALFRGEAPHGMAGDGEDDALTAAARAHLADAGLAPLPQPPLALPPTLTPRTAQDMEQGEDYWLHQTLHWRPGCLEALLGYAHYLTPRWGGTYEDIEGLAKGPLAAGLTEAQRNAIRWIGVFDSLCDYPDPTATRAVQEHDRRFAAWLTRDLRPEERGDALGRHANFTSYSLEDHPRAHALHVASVQAFDEKYFRQVDGPFRSFAHLTIIHHIPDDAGAFKTALQRMVRMDELGTPLALVAIAHQFGRWGFEQDPPLATSLLERAVQLGRHQLDDDFNILAAAAMLWDGGDHEAGYFLTRQLAERRVPEAASSMYDIHRGFRDNTPESYLDPAIRDHWLQRAVDDGSPLAMYNLAWRKIFEDKPDFSNRANLEAVLRLLEGAREAPRAEGYARLRIGVLLRDYGTPAEQQEGVRAYLRALIDSDDDWTAARASAEIALAYMQGRGAKKSRFAAIEWAQHATRLRPEDEEIEAIEARVLNSHSLVKTVGTVFGAFLTRGGLTADDLPPKPADA